MENKVIFGLENLHFGTYDTAADGTVTMGAPYHLPGSTRLALDPESEDTTFYADNGVYYKTTNDNGYTGELENANYTDEFKVRFLNWVNLPTGGIAQKKDKENRNVYMVFEIKGDKERRRGILWNVALGMINREYSTTENTKEPVTATLPITVMGDNATGLTRAMFKPTDGDWATIFTNPPAPVEPVQYVKTTDTTKAAGKIYYTVTASQVVNPVSYELDTYYEKNGTTYVLTEDTVVVNSKTYYQLSGVEVASPAANPATAGYYEAITD